jgi:hypothetical protein
MVQRHFWLKKTRRDLDCELPRVRRELEDPQAFLDRVRGRRIVLDEIHLHARNPLAEKPLILRQRLHS